MDWQTAFDIAIVLVGFLGGYILRGISTSISTLQKRDEDLLREVHQVHLLVAGDYVKRDELKSSVDGIFEALRRIEDSISGKADKK
jgi:hypothetical protein